MSNTSLQIPTQPVLKMATANMGLLMRFATSPEVMAQATTASSQLLQQSGNATLKLMQSGAFAQLMEGLLKNYADFIGESARAAMAWMQDGQAALARDAEQAAGSVIEAASTQARRGARAG